MNRIKRTLLLLGFAGLAAALCACTSLPSLRAMQLTALMTSESSLIQDKSAEIIRCLTKQDREGLRALFCQQVQQSNSFEQQLDAVFAFFPCEVYIQADQKDVASGGSSYDQGERTDWYVTPTIPYIEILQPAADGDLVSRYYGVDYYWKITDTAHPELEGLHTLTLCLLNTDETVTLGTDEWIGDP